MYNVKCIMYNEGYAVPQCIMYNVKCIMKPAAL